MTKSQETNNKVDYPRGVLGKSPNDPFAPGSPGLPPNGTFNLWQMLMAIMKYEKVNLDTHAELQKDWALALGATAGNHGIFQELYNVGVAVGNAQAQADKSAAYGQFASMGVDFVSLGAGAVTYFGSTRPATNDAEFNLKNVSEMKSAMNESQAAMTIKEQPKLDPNPKEASLLNGWANGSKPLDGFNGERPDGSIDQDAKAAHAQAIQHAANDPEKFETIMEKLNKREEALQGQIHSANTQLNTRWQLIGVASGGLKSAAQGGSGVGRAAAEVAQGKASAANTLVSSVQQQVVEQERKAQQNAEEALQQANQWASSFAQAAAAQVHA